MANRIANVYTSYTCWMPPAVVENKENMDNSKGGQAVRRGSFAEAISARDLLAAQHTANCGKVAYGTKQGTVVVADDAGLELWRCEAHKGAVGSLCFSPNGKHLIAGSKDNTATILDVASGKVQFVLTGHKGEVHAVHVREDGAQVATVSSDKTVRLWSLESGSCEFTLQGHTKAVTNAVYGPQGESGMLLMSWSTDRSIRIWHSTRGQQLYVMTHPTFVIQAAWHPQGAQIASAGNDVHIFESGKLVKVLPPVKGMVVNVTYIPTGDVLVGSDTKGDITIWDTTSWALLYTLQGHNGWVRGLALGPGGLLASASDDKSIRLWDSNNSWGCCAVLEWSSEISDVYWVHHNLVFGDQHGGVVCVAVLPQNNFRLEWVACELAVPALKQQLSMETLSSYEGLEALEAGLVAFEARVGEEEHLLRQTSDADAIATVRQTVSDLMVQLMALKVQIDETRVDHKPFWSRLSEKRQRLVRKAQALASRAQFHLEADEQMESAPAELPSLSKQMLECLPEDNFGSELVFCDDPTCWSYIPCAVHSDMLDRKSVV